MLSLRGAKRRGNLNQMFGDLQEIATPVCALARNDMIEIPPFS